MHQDSFEFQNMDDLIGMVSHWFGGRPHGRVGSGARYAITLPVDFNYRGVSSIEVVPQQRKPKIWYSWTVQKSNICGTMPSLCALFLIVRYCPHLTGL